MKTSSLARLTLVALAASMSLTLFAKKTEVTSTTYRRPSVYSILVKHSEQKFHKEIEEQFVNIPVPDKYNDHDLSVKVVSVDKKGDYTDDITSFVKRNNIASRLVARWFNRDITTGECDMNLVKMRGFEDASGFDRELAARSQRGKAMLEDAGQELIGHTYLLVNEVSYVDKAARSKTWGSILGGLMAVAGAAAGLDRSSTQLLASGTNALVSSYKGFSVKILTRLYRLKWDNDALYDFFENYYAEAPDDAKRKAFERARDKFAMEFVGEVESKGGTTSFLGINEDEPEIMVRKACTRAIDDNVADLAKKYDQFRVKCPITSVDASGGCTAEIGMKEAVSTTSKFEVLEAREDDHGKVTYKRVAILKPVAGRIWDNRFMAAEEGAPGANLGKTTFKKTSGGDILPGMLIREID